MSQHDGRPVRGASLTRQVMEHVRTAMRNRTMHPGQMYSVYQLAEELGVSRAPVREALTRLEEGGLIRFSRNRGFEVTPISAGDVAEIFALRLALEVPATRRAATLASAAEVAKAGELLEAMRACAIEGDEEGFFDLDQQFHLTILTAGAGRRLTGIVEHLRLTLRLAQEYTTHGERTLSETAEDHAPILAAVQSRDAEAAAEAMRGHLQTTAQHLMRHLREADREEAELLDELAEVLSGY